MYIVYLKIADQIDCAIFSYQKPLVHMTRILSLSVMKIKRKSVRFRDKKIYFIFVHYLITNFFQMITVQMIITIITTIIRLTVVLVVEVLVVEVLAVEVLAVMVRQQTELLTLMLPLILDFLLLSDVFEHFFKKKESRKT